MHLLWADYISLWNITIMPTYRVTAQMYIYTVSDNAIFRLCLQCVITNRVQSNNGELHNEGLGITGNRSIDVWPGASG